MGLEVAAKSARAACSISWRIFKSPPASGWYRSSPPPVELLLQLPLLVLSWVSTHQATTRTLAP